MGTNALMPRTVVLANVNEVGMGVKHHTALGR